MTIAEKWLTGFYDLAGKWFAGQWDALRDKFIVNFREEISLESLDENLIEDPALKKQLVDLKRKWKNSPTTPSEIVNDLFAILLGQIAEVQLEAIANIEIDETMPFTNRLMGQMGWMTSASMLFNSASMVAEIASVGQIDQIGRELRAYLDYSGLSQVTGFGYGMILSTAVTPMITQEMAQKTRHTLLDPSTATAMKYREIIDEDLWKDELSKLGFSDEKMTALEEVYKFYPAATDFIRFAVRDAFNEAFVSKWGLDSMFPSEMEPFVAKAGMDMDVLRWYWRAHWELPSPMMGYEMLHRGELTTEELEELLRMADYTPGYIPKMIAISYSPYTRVDAKRMYEAGILDDDGLTRAYKDIGYDDEKAANLLAWVQSTKVGSEKDLTKSMIINAYNVGLIGRPAALEYIEALGYDADESELIISLEDRKREQKYVEDSLGVLRYQYSRAVIDEAEFLRACAGLEIPTVRASQELIKAQGMKDKRIKEPSKTDLAKWLGAGLIDPGEYVAEMKAIGYQDRHIELYALEAGA